VVIGVMEVREVTQMLQALEFLNPQRIGRFILSPKFRTFYKNDLKKGIVLKT